MPACLALSAAGIGFPQDPAEIVRRSVNRDQINWTLAQNYTFVQRIEQRRLEKDGRVKSSSSRSYDVILIDGEPYRRLIARDDKPLPPEEAAREQKKLDKKVAELQRKSARERQERREKTEREREEQRAFLREVPEAYFFRLVGEESIRGRDTWVIECTPNPSFRPRRREARFLNRFHGTLWIDQTDYQWVKAEAESIDTVSFGWVLARLAKGSRIRFEQVYVNDEVWLVTSIRVRFDARLGLVAKWRGEVDVDFRDFKRFTTDSRIVSTGELPQ